MNTAVAFFLAATVFGEDNPAAIKLHNTREAFQRKMMPYVGKVVTVTGYLAVGKISDFVYTDDPGAVYVRGTKPGDYKKEEELSREMSGKRIAVTGKLRFAERLVPRNPDGSVRTDVTQIEEHFYIDIADATIRAVSRER